MKRRLTYTVLMFWALLAPAEAIPGGEDSIPSGGGRLSFRYSPFIEDKNVWLSTTNGAALVTFADSSISSQAVLWQYAKGGLVDYYQSPGAYTIDTHVESYTRLSDRVAVYGLMSYNHYYGHNMAGSAFIDPTRQPFDLTEDSLTNSGGKERDTYRLAGGVGVVIWRGAALGARADYTAASSAKYKDLRVKNSLLDLKLSVGVYIPVGKSVALGADYIYRRNIESLLFSTYGKNDRTYKTLINYGAFMGQVEQFGNSGFTEKYLEQPLFNEYHGASIQVEARCATLSFLSALTFVRRHGYYGCRSPYTVTFSHHSSNVYGYSGVISLRGSNSLHQITARAEIENLVNSRSTYRELLNDAGSTYYGYYDPVKTANKVWGDATIAYRAFLGLDGDMPTWTACAGTDIMYRKETAYYYPYYRRQKIGGARLFTALSRFLRIGRGLVSATLELSYLKGRGDPYDDGVFAEPSDKQTLPATMETYLYRNYEYLTSSRYSVGGAVGCSFFIKGVQTTAEARVEHRKANETRYLEGCDNTTIGIGIGCTF